MSTRANIIIQHTTKYGGNNPNNGLHLKQYYHHYDGYIMGLGVELVKLMIKFIEDNDPKEINSIFSIKCWLDNNLTLNYEPETEINPHGDIEYLYLINFDNGVTITALKRGNDSIEKWQEWESVEIFEAIARKYGNDLYYQLKSINLKEI